MYVRMYGWMDKGLDYMKGNVIDNVLSFYSSNELQFEIVSKEDDVFRNSVIKAIIQLKCSLFRSFAIINCVRLLGENITFVNGHPMNIFMPNFPLFLFFLQIYSTPLRL